MPDAGSTWEEVVAAALLGTDRRAFAAPEADGALGSVLAGLADRAPERALLGSASALGPYLRAGRKPGRVGGSIDENPVEDDRPRCPSGPASRLPLLFDHTFRPLLTEWLEALVRAGFRPPEEALPDLLEVARTDESARPAVLATIGPRGAWLARRNPDWSFAVEAAGGRLDPASTEDAWQTGTRDLRLALLQKLRASEPARGRELVASTWAVNGPADRAVFLEAFEVGLSDDDEPALEDALDDRRKEVRTVAADLLARLPASRLVRRMFERVAPLIRPSDRPPLAVDHDFARVWLEPGHEDETDAHKRLARGEHPLPAGPGEGMAIEVTLPAECDKAMVRDGVEPKSGRPGTGDKAWWLWQMVGRVPPSTWVRLWGHPPATLARAAADSQWSSPLLIGLLEAARRHRDADWIAELLPRFEPTDNRVDYLETLSALPPGRRDDLLMALLRGGQATLGTWGPRPLGDPHVRALAVAPGPWGEALTVQVIERLADSLEGQSTPFYALVDLLRNAARAMAPGAALAAVAGWSCDPSRLPAYYREQVESFLATLQFRHDMLQELRA